MLHHIWFQLAKTILPKIGDTPAVAAVLIDGIVRVNISRNTPPPQKKVSIPWMKAGGH